MVITFHKVRKIAKNSVFTKKADFDFFVCHGCVTRLEKLDCVTRLLENV